MAVATRPARRLSLDDIFFHASVLLKHLRLMVLCFCLVLLVGLYYYAFARPVYHSFGVIRVDAVMIPGDAGETFKDEDIVTVINELKSPRVVERTAWALGYQYSIDDVERYLYRRMAVGWREFEKVIVVELHSFHRNFADRWIRTLVEEFTKDREERRLAERDAMWRRYSAEMLSAVDNFRKSRTENFNFAQRNNLAELQLELASLSSIPNQIVQNNVRIREMEEVLGRIKDPELDVVSRLSALSSYERKRFALGTEVMVPQQAIQAVGGVPTVGGGMVPAGQQIGGAPVAAPAQIAGTAAVAVSPLANQTQRVIITPDMAGENNSNRWEPLASERGQLLEEIRVQSGVYMPGHRVIRALTNRLEEVNRRLNAQWESSFNLFVLDYAAALSERQRLNQQLPLLQEKQRQVDELMFQFTSLNSRQFAWDQIYRQMSQSLGRMDYAIDRPRTRLSYIGLRSDSSESVVPNKGRLLLMTVAVGLALAAAAAYLTEFLDNSVTRLERVEDDLRVKALGLVPAVGDQSRYAAPGGQGMSMKRHILENFRVIRTNILLDRNPADEHQVILVSSSIPKEGKTFVSSNLALSFAQLGRKTLLIDCDMRKGRMHKTFNRSVNVGLREVLMEGRNYKEMLVPGNHPNLDVLCAGKFVPDAVEKMGNETFAKLIEQWRQEYDKVILDSPPVLGLPEVPMLQSYADGVIFVIWAGRTPMSGVRTAINTLVRSGARMIGFVLNRLDLSQQTNYNYYYYYSYEYYSSYQETKALPNAAAAAKPATKA